MKGWRAFSSILFYRNIEKTGKTDYLYYMDTHFKILVSEQCGCCKPLVEKMEKYCREKKDTMEVVELSDVKEIPEDLTGVPYIIIIHNGMYVTSFQGDSPENILRQRIESSLEKHKEIIDRRK